LSFVGVLNNKNNEFIWVSFCLTRYFEQLYVIAMLDMKRIALKTLLHLLFCQMHETL